MPYEEHDMDTLIKDCIRQMNRMNEMQLRQYLKDEGVKDELIPLVTGQAIAIDSRIRSAKQRIYAGIVLSVIGFGSMFVRAVPVLFYGAAAAGVVSLVSGVMMMNQTKYYR